MQATLAPMMPEHLRRWRTMLSSMTTWSNNVRVLRTFADQRPINMRQHIVTHFGLGGFVTVTLDAAPRAHGRLGINTLVIDETTPGTTNNAPYPWRGMYFRGVPVRLRALPAPGYAFAGWNGRPELGAQDTITVNLTNPITYTALFEQAPLPHNLSSSPYRLEGWSADAPAGSFPPHMRFEQTMTQDPGLAVPMDAPWQLPYNRTNRSRINGLGAAGFAFLNTSDPQTDQGAGYLGAAVLAIKTVGVTNARVGWVGGTVLPNNRAYAVRLQYRVGEAAWQDILGPNAQPVEYVRQPAAGHQQVLTARLPAAAENQPYVQLRWKYYYISGGSGPRAQLRVDDLLVWRDTPASAPRLNLFGFDDQGRFNLSFVGDAYRIYRVETSTNLLDWKLLHETETDLRGQFNWSESHSAVGPARFFRLVMP
jgi:hypothetical protein